ncbi:MAG: hypothetical protein CME06_08275 [Gemmatimonadetes bacterium]|nr:hypothetical protein [Gemmatimonadota bacterium]
MRRLLIITTLDFEREPNQRVQVLASLLRPDFDEVVAVYRVQRDPQGPAGDTIGVLTQRTSRDERDGIVRVAVDPLWNAPRGRDLRYIGFIKEPMDIGGLAWGVLRHAPGPFDVAIAEGPTEGAAAHLLRALGRVERIVYDDFDWVPGWHRRRFRVKALSWLERWAIAGSDRVVSTGQYLALLRRVQTGRSPVWIPNGTPRRLRPDESEISTKDGGDSEPILLYTGNLHLPYSGLDAVIAAMPAIRSRAPGTRLIVVGSGSEPDLAAIHGAITKAHVAGAVELVGRVQRDEVDQYLRRATIGMAMFPPSRLRRFAFPYKVIEYMGAGLSVVGTECSETARIIRSHGIGETVPFEPEAIAGGVSRLLGDTRRRREIAERGYAAAEGYLWERIGDRYREVIHSLQA